MESRKMILKSWLAGQKWRIRHREQTYGHGERGWEAVMYEKSNMETYIAICKITVEKGGDICVPMADSCWGLTKNNKFCKAVILKLKKKKNDHIQQRIKSWPSNQRICITERAVHHRTLSRFELLHSLIFTTAHTVAPESLQKRKSVSNKWFRSHPHSCS